MNYNIVKLFFLLTVLSAFWSCDSLQEREEKQLIEEADSFAVTYFNWQFYRTPQFCTPESLPWLQYAASQVHQADIDVLNEQSFLAETEIADVQRVNDTLAQVTFRVSHYLGMDTIGEEGHIVDESQFVIPAIRRQGRWLMHLDAMPRPVVTSTDR